MYNIRVHYIKINIDYKVIILLCCLTDLQALIIRDVFVLSVLSIGFELFEYTLEPQLPNFGECWWDHVSLHNFCTCTCNYTK